MVSVGSVNHVFTMFKKRTKIFHVQNAMQKLDKAVAKQAFRDLSSKDCDLSEQAILYFHSGDFQKLCSRNQIDVTWVEKCVAELIDFPLISRKNLSNDIARVIDGYFGGK